MNRKLDYLLGVPLANVLGIFSPKKRGEIPLPKKLLLIKLAAAGDTVFMIPPIRSIKKAHPQIQIHWLVSNVNRDIAETVPYVDKLIAVTNFRPGNLLSLIKNLRKEKYDLAIDFEQWARGTAILSFLSGAPFRIGFETPGQFRGNLFTHTFLKKYQQHEIYDFFKLIPESLGVKVDTELELWETEKGKREVLQVCPQITEPSKSIKILIHPGCGSDGTPREWPLPNYAVLINWLIKKFNASIFLSGGPDEFKKTGDLAKFVKSEAQDLGGRFSWQGTISLVKQADLIISGNTGIMHIAAAFKKPQIALHGPTDPKIWGPLNSRAIILKTSCPHCPCLKLGFEYHDKTQSCMKKIEVDQVKDAVSALIDKNGKI